VDADEYLKHLSRYIHLNPVRAKIVDSASDYQWSSYNYFIGKKKIPGWIEANWLLSQFGQTLKEAKQNYKAFVEQADAQTLENPSKDATGGLILGGEDFVKWVKEQFIFSHTNDQEKPQLKILKPRCEVSDIISVVEESFECSQEQILAKGKKKNRARDIAIYLCKDLSGIKGKELGTIFGGVSGAAITMRCKAVDELISTNRRLKQRIERLTKRIVNT
jgi:hypothetical protein